MAVVGEATIKVRPDVSTFGNELYRDANGRLRDARNRFAKGPGQEIGRGLSEGAQQGFARGEGGFVKSAGGIARKVVGVFAGIFAGAAIGTALFSSVTAASDIGESMSKVQVVFGDAAAGVEKFASTSAQALGQSEAQVLEATGTFGNLLRSVGLSETASSKFSTSMVQLATDLGSFNNADPTEVLEALRSGLVGETEPLKRFGINLNEAVLQQKALELGLVSGKGPLDANAKAQAAYALIMEQTSLAQGDFARTAGGAANQQRILKASIEDAKVALGQGLLPGLTAVLPAVTGLVDAMGPALGMLGKSLGASLGQIVPTITPILSALLPVIGTVVDQLGGVLGSVFEALAPVIAALAPPVQMIVRVMGGALVGVVRALAPILTELAGVLGPVLTMAVEGLADLLIAVQPGLNAFGKVIASVLSEVGPMLAELGKNVLAELRPQLPELTEALVLMAESFGEILTQLVPLLPPLIKLSLLILTKLQVPVIIKIAQAVGILAAGLAAWMRFVAPLRDVLIELVSKGIDKLSAAIEWLTGLFTTGGLQQGIAMFGAGLSRIGEAVMSAVHAVGTGVEAIVRFFQELPGRLVAGIAALPGLLLTGFTTALSFAVNAVISGITTMIAQFVSLPFRILDAVLTLGPKLLGFLARLFPQLIAAELRGLGLMVGFFLALPGRVISAVTTLAPKLVGAVASALRLAADAAGRGVTAIVTGIGKLPGKILGLAGDIAGAGKTIGGKIISGIKAGLSGAAGAVADIAGALADKLAEVMHSLVQKINDAIPDKIGPFGLPHNPVPNPFAFGGVTTEGRIDGTGSSRPEVVVPLSRGRKLAAAVARESGLLDMIGLGTGSPLFGMEVPVSVSFVGVVPTQAEAAAVGRTIGDQIAARALARRRVMTDARTSKVSA